MKRIVYVALIMMSFLYSSEALAAKARSITTDADSAYHSNHLELHIGQTDCFCTGNYVKVRTQQNGNKVVGHLEQADHFNLADVRDGWALIQVTASAGTSPDSYIGMTGWIDANYIDCLCSNEEYLSNNVNSGDVLPNDVLLPFQWTCFEDVLNAYYYVASEIMKTPIGDQQMREVDRLLGVSLEPNMYPSLDTGYILRDLDHNGTDELIILEAGGESFEDGMLITLYAMENQRPKLLLFGLNRSVYYLTTDNGIANYGSDGASYYRYYVFDVVDSNLSVRGGIITDWDEIDGEVCFYTTDTDLDTSNDIRIDIEDAYNIRFAQEDHNPEGFIPFRNYKPR